MTKIICSGLCKKCLIQGFCRAEERKIVTSTELENDFFRVDACNSIYNDVIGIPYRQCPDYYANKYRDFNGWFSDEDGNEIFPDLNPLWNAPDEWWRDNFYHHYHDGKPLALRTENRERLTGLFSLYRALNPKSTLIWGIRPANDNQE